MLPGNNSDKGIKFKLRPNFNFPHPASGLYFILICRDYNMTRVKILLTTGSKSDLYLFHL